MGDFVKLFLYWASLELLDWFVLILILVTSLVIMVSAFLFHSFIKAKPAGRKTVLGNIHQVP